MSNCLLSLRIQLVGCSTLLYITIVAFKVFQVNQLRQIGWAVFFSVITKVLVLGYGYRKVPNMEISKENILPTKRPAELTFT